MKKTQTIVDREHLSSDYIESKQDFSNVLSQVKLLPSTTWKSPWFYGPIGIAVLSVTISIVSLNPTNAIASIDESDEKQSVINLNDDKEKIDQVITKNKSSQVVEKNLIPSKEVVTTDNIKKNDVKPLISKEDIAIQEVIDEVIENPVREVRVERKINVNSQFPHIDGYYTGQIPIENLFSEKGIVMNETVQVVSFDLNFFTGRSNVVNQIRGNKIPAEMYSMITNFNIGKTIFITNIKAFDKNGRSYTLPSINFTPI